MASDDPVTSNKVISFCFLLFSSIAQDFHGVLIV